MLHAALDLAGCKQPYKKRPMPECWPEGRPWTSDALNYMTAAELKPLYKFLMHRKIEKVWCSLATLLYAYHNGKYCPT
jgi:hypothetical protein